MFGFRISIGWIDFKHQLTRWAKNSQFALHDDLQLEQGHSVHLHKIEDWLVAGDNGIGLCWEQKWA